VHDHHTKERYVIPIGLDHP